LRERLFLIGLIYLVPLYRANSARPLFRTLAKAALIFVIVFQTTALWDYAIRADRDAREFLSASTHIPNDASLAAITIVPNGTRFSANPLAQMDNYIGVGREILVYDNYEFGHYLFPIVAKRRDDQEFVRVYTSANGFVLNDPDSYTKTRIDRLTEVLAGNNQRIDTLLVWGNDPEIEAAYKPWFEAEPFFENGRVRLYRHR
jgi:hypothetical protein